MEKKEVTEVAKELETLSLGEKKKKHVVRGRGFSRYLGEHEQVEDARIQQGPEPGPIAKTKEDWGPTKKKDGEVEIQHLRKKPTQTRGNGRRGRGRVVLNVGAANKLLMRHLSPGKGVSTRSEKKAPQTKPKEKKKG